MKTKKRNHHMKHDLHEHCGCNALQDRKDENALSCGCEHCAQKASEALSSDKNLLSAYQFDFIKIALSSVLLILTLLLKNQTAKFIVFALSALICGYELLFDCFKNIVKGKIFNENILMCVASVTAFILGEYFEGAFIVVLFTLGETLESIATTSSRKKIAGLADLKSTEVHLICASGLSDVLPEQIEIGSIIEIRKGERVPIDGMLIGKAVELDVKAITGESKLKTIENGEEIFSGSINVGNSFTMRTTKLYKDSTVEKIIGMVDGATSKKAKSQKFIASFAKVYTPIVFGVAFLIAAIVPLFDNMDFIKWIYKSLSFLVVSCPCALVISVPLAFFVGIGSLAKNGILIKGSICIENLSKINSVVFDKTGTLTNGSFVLDKIVTEKTFEEKEVLELVGALESKSNHPISKVIVKNINVKKTFDVLDVVEVAGRGLSGVVDGKKVVAGNYNHLMDSGVEVNKIDYIGTVIYAAIDGIIAQYIFLCDQIKESSAECIKNLSRFGINNTYMISGDSEKIAKKIGKDLGIGFVYSEMLPDQKLAMFKSISKQNDNRTMYVGDGINDSPTLSTASVGVAMGGLGSEIAIDSADVVIMDDDLKKIPFAIKYSRKIRTTVTVNIIGSLLVKFAIMLFSVITHVPVWIAMFGDVGVMILAVLNSLLIVKIRMK